MDVSRIDNEITNLVSEIKSNTAEVAQKMYDAVDLGELEFNGVEKLLMHKLFNAVNEELKKIKEREVKYQDIKGSWHEILNVTMTEWPEFKQYYTFIDDDAFHNALKEQIRNSCRKYGFPMENVFQIEIPSYTFGATFRYRYVDFGCNFWKPKQ